MPDLHTVAQAIQDFGGDLQRSGGLASLLGFTPVQTPADLLGGSPTPLRRFFEARTDRFGVGQLYRLGSIGTDGASVGMYLAVLDNWGLRSTDRDRARRRVARAVVELTTDARAVFLMAPHRNAPPADLRHVEFVFPRSTVDVRRHAGGGALTTIRALVDLHDPTRFHRELLRDLAVEPGSSLTAISQKWQQAFSVERVTKRFYQQYADVRNELARVLKSANPDHPVIRELSEHDANAWATRQLGRILFLWFLQAKRWLGYQDAGEGSETYLLDLWRRRSEAPAGFHQGMLLPLFFEAMAERRPRPEVRQLLGYTPYLNGGLFRRNALEDRIESGGTVSIPDEAFDPDSETTALGLLRSYRFTTRESTPDDQSVDPDPELLGRVFENLYQGDERHDTGTYYTPREIVHFMCRQVLDGYLRDTAGVDQETIDWLRRLVTEPDGDERRLDEATERNLTAALENVRICDPAVGSGAFLLGAMQEIVQLRRGMLHARQQYAEDEQEQVAAWKRRAIQWSLYGVDINPEAVEICQLRLWLSLVLDMWDPRTVDPLPNLDFRIVAADSLVDRVGDIVFAESLGGTGQPPLKPADVEREERTIARWRREFEATQDNPARLRELRNNITRAYHRVVKIQLESALTQAQEEARTAAARARSVGRTALNRAAERARARVRQLEEALASTDADAPYQKPFLWPVAFKEVFDDGGFDAVLANPPYVRQERLSATDQTTYASTFPEVHTGTADILVYFYARAVQILRQGGWLSFITSNKYMRAAYGEPMRAHLPQALAFQHVIDFGDLPLFEANGRPVAAYPAVTIARKGNVSIEHRLGVADLTYPIRRALADGGVRVNPEAVREALEEIEGLLATTQVSEYPQVLLRREGWILEEPTLLALFDRLMAQGIPLHEYVRGRMYNGIKSGLNEAFVIDAEKRSELIAQDPETAEIIRPWIRGRDVDRWRARSDRYLLCMYRGIDASHYPAALSHLKPFKDRLLRRDQAGKDYPWWELSRPRNEHFDGYAGPKIIFNRFTNRPIFSYDDSGSYHTDSCYSCACDDLSLLAVLNSRVCWWMLSKLCTPLQNGYYQLFIQFLERLPIPRVSPAHRELLTESVNQVLIQPTADLEEQIEHTVASAYGLSVAEEESLNRWFERTMFQRLDDSENDADEEE
jgi:adenine-specific DNA-methyltransferase